MTALIAFWSHALAAALYAALAVQQSRHWSDDKVGRPLLGAFAAMSFWSLFLALTGPYHFLALLTEGARNLVFLAFLHGLAAGAARTASQRALSGVFAAVAGAVGLQMVVVGAMPGFAGAPAILAALISTSQVIGMIVAAGSLILVHNVYGQATPESRASLRFPMFALAAMWAYDLHLYTVAYFTHAPDELLFALRGAVMAALAIAFAAGIRNTSWKIQISRAATFQSVSVIAVLAYLIVMMMAARAMEIVGADWAWIGQIAIVAVMSVAVMALLPSGKLRAWLRVTIAKHLFEHRYDYRQEWLRFIDTVGRQGEAAASLEERVVKALADIGGAPAGLLLVAGDDYRLAAAGRWNWTIPAPSIGTGAEDLLRHIEREAFVLDFATIRGGALAAGSASIPVPAWLASMETAWAGIPLIHDGRLAGLVILEHPPFRRPLDWEDFDLFRTAGIQAASYIAEARGQQALADARRFDEFNRRFAFIMHDIKNLVSQLSLVARNAERHADNPEFRADMIATLQSSVRKMNDLLARLSPGATRGAEPARAVEIRSILESVAAAKRPAHPVRIGGDTGLVARADPVALEQALAHLVQNAIDASDPGSPVDLKLFESGGDVAIEVVDRGRGMSGAFVRDRLFQPFVSTKEQGFGIGAYEARALILAMGGRLDVESVEGEGTKFTLYLPGTEILATAHQERMRA